MTANGIQAAHVEVDPDLGTIRVLDVWVVDDCGRVINPLLVDEQIRGGVVQGLGAALYEECIYGETGAAAERQPRRLSRADGRRDARHPGRPRGDADRRHDTSAPAASVRPARSAPPPPSGLPSTTP